MNSAPRPSSNLLYRRLGVLCVLGVIVLFGLRYFSKFPHSGSWMGAQQQDTTGTYITQVSFQPNGSCSWDFKPVSPGSTPENPRYNCSYQMSGGAANMTLTLKDMQWSAGGWHLATTAKQKALAPLFNFKVYYRVTPMEEGKELFVEPKWTELVDQKTGKSRYYPYSDQQTLKRVAP